MRLGILIAGCLLLLAEAAAAQPRLQPIVVDQEQIFDITWRIDELEGRPILDGYIANKSFYWAARIQLLVDQLDATGRVVHQQLAWLGVVLFPGERSYFDVSVPDAKARYTVQVYAFTRGFGTELK
jgi:hypothetical protein